MVICYSLVHPTLEKPYISEQMYFCTLLTEMYPWIILVLWEVLYIVINAVVYIDLIIWSDFDLKGAVECICVCVCLDVCCIWKCVHTCESVNESVFIF